MFDYKSAAEWRRLWRYYQAGIVNTLFGFALYSGFIWSGVSMYPAQICAHVIGSAFNYFTYSRYAFQTKASKIRFAGSYIFNYFVSLGSLMAASQIVSSPYLAGFLSIIISSVINYFVLSRLIFSESK